MEEEKANVGEKSKEDWYEFDVICMYCKRKIGTKWDKDPKQKGIPSHGICDECMKEKFPDEPEDKE